MGAPYLTKVCMRFEKKTYMYTNNTARVRVQRRTSLIIIENYGKHVGHTFSDKSSLYTCRYTLYHK